MPATPEGAIASPMLLRSLLEEPEKCFVLGWTAEKPHMQQKAPGCQPGLGGSIGLILSSQ